MLRIVARLTSALVLLPVAATAAGHAIPIVDAARAGNGAALRALLEQRVDVNASEPDGATALHWAADRGDVTAVELLLRAGARATVANRYGVTPLSLAAASGNAAVVDRLIKSGASPNTAAEGGETVLMTAARAGRTDVVRALLKAGADVNARESTRGQTALMWAAAEGHADLIRLLVDHGANLTATSHGPASKDTTDGDWYYKRPTARLDVCTPLQFAVRAGHVDATMALLDAGANIRDETPDGVGLLTMAIVNGSFELAVRLIDRGADVNAARIGWTPLHQVVRVGTTNILHGPPRPQPARGVTGLDVAKRLLAHGADVNARTTKPWDDGYRGGFGVNATPFLLAAKGADMQMMALLAAYGADVTAPNVNGTTPLMAAAGIEMSNPNEDSGRDVDAFAALQLAVALGAGDLNAVDRQGNTALHGAIGRVSPDFAKLLVERGARVDVRNKRGQLPIDVALGGAAVGGTRPDAAKILRDAMLARGLTPPALTVDDERFTFGVKVAK